MTDRQAKRIGVHRARRMTHIFDRRHHGPTDDAEIAAALVSYMSSPAIVEDTVSGLANWAAEQEAYGGCFMKLRWQ